MTPSDGLGARQIELAGQEGSHRELAGLRRRRSACSSAASSSSSNGGLDSV